MSRKGTIGDLIERARRNEDIGLRHDNDVLLQAHLESILESAQRGIRPSSDDDIDLMTWLLPFATVPQSKGAPRKSQQARQGDADIKAEARDLQGQLKDWEATVIEMKRRHPDHPALKVKPRKHSEWETLRDRWSRR